MVIGRIMDLVLAFPFLLIILALSGVADAAPDRVGSSGWQPIANRVPDPRHQHLRLALPRAHRARPGAQPARARVRRGGSGDGRRQAAHPVHRDPAQPLGTDPRLRNPDAARLHRPGGRTFVPRRRHHPARRDLRRMLAKSVAYFQVVPNVPVHPRHDPGHHRRRVQPCSATRSATRSIQKLFTDAHGGWIFLHRQPAHAWGCV